MFTFTHRVMVSGTDSPDNLLYSIKYELLASEERVMNLNELSTSIVSCFKGSWPMSRVLQRNTLLWKPKKSEEI